MSKDPWIISGAGLVGSLLAVALGKKGYPVEVYELRQDPRTQTSGEGDRSINLALANRGISALKAFGVFDLIEPLLIPMSGRMVHRLDGSLDFQRYGQKDFEVIYSVSRNLLNQRMATAAEQSPNVTLHFGKAVREVDTVGRSITFADGTSRNYQALIGADGVGSVVRKALLGTKEASVTKPLGHSYKELKIYPAPDGSYRMKKEALHIWARGEFMLIALPNLDGSFTVTLFLPTEGPQSFAALTDKELVRQFFAKHFADALDLMPDLTEQFFANPTGFLGTISLDKWHQDDSILLIGDAAHAIVPFHGQGMNCGFEDCEVLLSLLAERKLGSGLFNAFYELRKPNCDAIAELALENYVEMRAKVNEQQFLLQKEIAFILEREFPELFVPRYSLVMFHQVPYHYALKAGQAHLKILEQLAVGLNKAQDVDLAQAKNLLTKYCPALPS